MSDTSHGLWRGQLLAVALLVGPASVQAEDVPRLFCEVRCSQEKLRTGIATISWIGSERATGVGAVRAGEGPAPQLDVTVFRRGFERGEFATLDRMSKGAEPTRRPRPAGDDGTPRPPLRAFALTVTEVRTDAGVALPQGAGRLKAGSSERVAIEVEGLEPGVVYTWRLRPPGQTQSTAVVSCEAPVCTADFQEPEERR